jgi:hypothetical protein
MRVFAVRIELANVAAAQSSHDADPPPTEAALLLSHNESYDGFRKPDHKVFQSDVLFFKRFLRPNEGAKVSYEEVPNKGKTSAENLRVG